MRLCNECQSSLPEAVVSASSGGSAYQSATSVPQRVVDAFCRVGASVAFLTRTVLPCREECGIDGIAVGVDQATLPSLGNAPPQGIEAVKRAISDEESENLSAIAADRRPEPQILLAADAQLVDFQRINAQRLNLQRHRRRDFF